MLVKYIALLTSIHHLSWILCSKDVFETSAHVSSRAYPPRRTRGRRKRHDATVLARAISSESVENFAVGCNPMELSREDGTTTAEISLVATISADGDTHVRNLIAQAMEKVGKEGVMTVKEGRTVEDEIEITEGMRFDRGFISPYFVTDVKAQKVEFDKPLILLSEKKISLLQDILPALEAAAQSRRPLLIVAEDVYGEALAACILNKLRGQLQVAAVKAPGFGDNRKSILGDLAILTGGQVFSDELEVKLEKASVELLGSTGSVTVTKDDTIILDGEGSKDAIQARCEQIRSLVADRYDDALNATRAVVEEGILPWGGVALLKASLRLATTSPATSAGNARARVAIIRRAITNPARTIYKNPGEESSIIMGRILGEYAMEGKFNWGYDAGKGEYVDMVERGIVDPLKVVRTVLVDAAGVASLLTTSEACVVEVAEEEGASKGPMGGMGGGIGGMGMGWEDFE
ncbi:heat shock protein 60, mitochondrial precursor [Ephemerocybe angulata]|uniref:Heat shock protein 60, mitochondrial n=1 Tax=Ephemerocybe angulata TaxID=980116 RepID=A0A8H6HHG0_9AGAR|nr:heat shock protein 60, mitochondrial precursor [Tulosesus angulatus]